MDLVLADHFGEGDAEFGGAHGAGHGQKHFAALIEVAAIGFGRVHDDGGVEVTEVVLDEFFYAHASDCLTSHKTFFERHRRPAMDELQERSGEKSTRETADRSPPFARKATGFADDNIPRERRIRGSAHKARVVQNSGDGFGVAQRAAANHSFGRASEKRRAEMRSSSSGRAAPCVSPVAAKIHMRLADEAGGREDLKQFSQAPGGVAGFLGQFAMRGRHWRFSGVHSSRDQFPEKSARGMTVLANQKNLHRPGNTGITTTDPGCTTMSRAATTPPGSLTSVATHAENLSGEHHAAAEQSWPALLAHSRFPSSRFWTANEGSSLRRVRRESHFQQIGVASARRGPRPSPAPVAETRPLDRASADRRRARALRGELPARPARYFPRAAFAAERSSRSG